MFSFPPLPICVSLLSVRAGKGWAEERKQRHKKHTHKNKGRERVGSNSALRFHSHEQSPRQRCISGASTSLGNCSVDSFPLAPPFPVPASPRLDHVSEVMPESRRVALALSDQILGAHCFPSLGF